MGSRRTNNQTKKHPSGENTGRWTKEEHHVFLEGLKEYGKEWKKIAGMIPTRTVVQIRTHAQKYFQKLAKTRELKGEEIPTDLVSTASNTRGIVERQVQYPSDASKRAAPGLNLSNIFHHDQERVNITSLRNNTPLHPSTFDAFEESRYSSDDEPAIMQECFSFVSDGSTELENDGDESDSFNSIEPLPIKRKHNETYASTTRHQLEPVAVPNLHRARSRSELMPFEASHVNKKARRHTTFASSSARVMKTDKTFGPARMPNELVSPRSSMEDYAVPTVNKGGLRISTSLAESYFGNEEDDNFSKWHELPGNSPTAVYELDYFADYYSEQDEPVFRIDAANEEAQQPLAGSHNVNTGARSSVAAVHPTASTKPNEADSNKMEPHLVTWLDPLESLSARATTTQTKEVPLSSQEVTNVPLDVDELEHQPNLAEMGPFTKFVFGDEKAEEPLPKPACILTN